MIVRIAGKLDELIDASAVVATATGLTYEVLIPACDVERLSRRVGQDVVLHTLHYLEGDPAHGMQTPRLIGFQAETDRAFFVRYITVKGIGVRKALRSLVRPPAEVAGAIQNKDAKFLKALPEIGARTAERVIAELSGTLEEFAGPAQSAEPADLPASGEEAIAVLVQLGERRADAAALVERVLAVAPDLESAEDILQQAYKLKAGGI
jgi:Holliday junction DNA helicase RuvA